MWVAPEQLEPLGSPCEVAFGMRIAALQAWGRRQNRHACGAFQHALHQKAGAAAATVLCMRIAALQAWATGRTSCGRMALRYRIPPCGSCSCCKRYYQDGHSCCRQAASPLPSVRSLDASCTIKVTLIRQAPPERTNAHADVVDWPARSHSCRLQQFGLCCRSQLVQAVIDDLQLDTMPAGGRDPADEKVRMAGLIEDDMDDAPGDVCDLCNGQGTLLASESYWEAAAAFCATRCCAACTHAVPAADEQVQMADRGQPSWAVCILSSAVGMVCMQAAQQKQDDGTAAACDVCNGQGADTLQLLASIPMGA